ncbi:hypothetical protein D3C77_664600 [compost metagenome]
MSRNTCSIPARDSRVRPSLIKIPRRAARDIPDKMAIGTARISGQGVATTSTASTRKGSSLKNQANPAVSKVNGINAKA